MAYAQKTAKQEAHTGYPCYYFWAQSHNATDSTPALPHWGNTPSVSWAAPVKLPWRVTCYTNLRTWLYLLHFTTKLIQADCHTQAKNDTCLIAVPQKPSLAKSLLSKVDSSCRVGKGQLKPAFFKYFHLATSWEPEALFTSLPLAAQQRSELFILPVLVLLYSLASKQLLVAMFYLKAKDRYLYTVCGTISFFDFSWQLTSNSCTIKQ